jgi:hypothetical protein
MIEAGTAPTDDLQALLGMSEDDLAQLPPEAYSQVQEMLQQAQEAAKAAEQQRQQLVQGLGQRIIGVYQQRVAQRQHLEQRWLKDIRRYNGEYDPEILKALQNRKYGSQQYVPLVRRIVNIVEARLTDLLFPTEERNFAIDPSPVPMLIQAEALASQLPPDAMIPTGPNGQPMPAGAVMSGIRELREEARAKADGMQREVDDQLRQANYGAASRRAIHEAMVIGTGVIKGPMVLNRTKKVWKTDGGQARLERIEDLSPTAVDVSAWDFFPDLSAKSMRESESEIERHYFTKAQLAGLAKQPGFSDFADTIREVLRTPAAAQRDAMRDSLRESSGTEGVTDPRYMVMEFHGPIDYDELDAMGLGTEDDPLECYEGIVWVTETGQVINATINPMDTAERPYSVYCWEKDPGSIFGFGLSYELADMSESANSSFRAALDNLGLSVGPQIVVNSKVMRPHNGEWVIEPNKIWELVKSDADARSAFAFFQIDGRIGELMGVFDRCKQLMDDVGGPSMAMQGSEAPSYLDTARGVSIAHNAANIWMRRAVRNWDDDMTSPLVGRFVDWNMQYSPKSEIKGDMLVLSRGTSALLEAESSTSKMAMFMQQAQGIPMPFARKVKQLRALARSLRLDADDILPDEAETKKMAEQMDNQGPPPNPEMERIKLRQAEIADKGAEREHALLIENERNKLRLAEIASREGLTMEAARTKYGIEALKAEGSLQDRREQRQHDAQALNAELAVKIQTGSGI